MSGRSCLTTIILNTTVSSIASATITICVVGLAEVMHNDRSVCSQSQVVPVHIVTLPLREICFEPGVGCGEGVGRREVAWIREIFERLGKCISIWDILKSISCNKKLQRNLNQMLNTRYKHNKGQFI